MGNVLLLFESNENIPHEGSINQESFFVHAHLVKKMIKFLPGQVDDIFPSLPLSINRLSKQKNPISRRVLSVPETIKPHSYHVKTFRRTENVRIRQVEYSEVYHQQRPTE